MVRHTTRPATHRPIRQQGNNRSGDAQARRAGTCAAVGEGRSAEARGPPHQYISNGASERLLRGGWAILIKFSRPRGALERRAGDEMARTRSTILGVSWPLMEK